MDTHNKNKDIKDKNNKDKDITDKNTTDKNIADKNIIEISLYITDVLTNKELDENITNYRKELEHNLKGFELITKSSSTTRQKYVCDWAKLHENFMMQISKAYFNGYSYISFCQDKLILLEKKYKSRFEKKDPKEVIVFTSQESIDKYISCIDKINKKIQSMDREKAIFSNIKTKLKENVKLGIEIFSLLSISYILIKLEEKLNLSKIKLIKEKEFEKQFYEHDIGPINNYLISLFYFRKLLTESLLIKKVDDCIKGYDLALSNSVHQTYYIYTEDLKRQKDNVIKTIDELYNLKVKTKQDLEDLKKKIKKLEAELNDINNSIENNNKQLEVIKFTEEKISENSNNSGETEYYDNVNLGSGSSSDVILVVNQLTGEQLSGKCSRKINTSRTFIDSYKKFSWVKNEIDAFKILTNIRILRFHKVENLIFHRCIILPCLPYNDIDANIKMFTSNRIAEVNYFYAIYIEKNFSKQLLDCFFEKENTYIRIKSNLKYYYDEYINKEIQELKISKEKEELIKQIKDKYNETITNEFNNVCKMNFFLKFNFSSILYILNELYEILKILAKFNSSHKDFKPHNVLFAEDFSLLMIDFQLNVFCVIDEFIKTNSHGTPLYQGPDKYMDLEKIDHKTNIKIDLYSLGVFIQKLASGTFYEDIISTKANKSNVMEELIAIEKKSGPINDYSTYHESKNSKNQPVIIKKKKALEYYREFLLLYYFYKEISNPIIYKNEKYFINIPQNTNLNDKIYDDIFDKVLINIVGELKLDEKDSPKTIKRLDYLKKQDLTNLINQYVKEERFKFKKIVLEHNSLSDEMKRIIDLSQLIVNLINPSIKERCDLEYIEKFIKKYSEYIESLYSFKKIFENMDNNNKAVENMTITETIKKRANRKPLIEIQKISFFQDYKTSSYIKKKLYIQNQYFFQRKKLYIEEV